MLQLYLWWNTSTWCQRELEHAERHKPHGIVLARLVSECHTPLQHEIESKYTYGDFRVNFEAGFRRITTMMLGQPVSSWEAYYLSDDLKLLEAVGHGLIPGVIVKEFVEWVVVEKLWKPIENYVESVEAKSFRFFRGKPHTAIGIWREMHPIAIQFEERQDMIGHTMIEEARSIVEQYLREIDPINDTNHRHIGQSSREVLSLIVEITSKWAIMFRDSVDFWHAQNKFTFDTSEKLRSLIRLYSRRSRYLY